MTIPAVFATLVALAEPAHVAGEWDLPINDLER